MASTDELKATVEKFIGHKAVRSARAWDRGGVLVELVATDLAKRGLAIKGASFDDETVEFKGFDLTIKL